MTPSAAATMLIAQVKERMRRCASVRSTVVVIPVSRTIDPRREISSPHQSSSLVPELVLKLVLELVLKLVLRRDLSVTDRITALVQAVIMRSARSAERHLHQM